MAGIYNVIKVWSDQEVISNTDLNNEFSNVKNNLISTAVEGYSSFNNVYSLSRVQATIDPAPGGDPSASSDNQTVAGEVQKLRYAIKRMLGASATQWYSTPASDLSVLATALSAINATPYNGVSSGATNANGLPMYLLPSGSTNSVTLKCSVTPLVCYINGTQYTFSSDITLTGLTLAPSSGNTAAVDKDLSLYDSSGATPQNNITSSKTVGESYAGFLDPTGVSTQEYLPLKTVGSNISAASGKLIGFKLNAEYSVGYPQNSGTRMYRCYRGFFFDSAGAWIPRVATSTTDTLTMMRLTYIFLRSGGTLTATYNAPVYSSTQPATPSTGDFWYDTVNKQWKSYTGSSFVTDNSIFVGYCMQNTTATVAARSADFFATFSNQSSVEIKRDVDVASQIVCESLGNRISVYGNNLYYEGNNLKWSIGTDLDTGVTLSSNKQLFLYVSYQGKPVISDIAPHSRDDLLGHYHPAAPWRCVGTCATDGTNFNYFLVNYGGYPFNLPRTIYFNTEFGSFGGTGAFGLVAGVYLRGRPIRIDFYPSRVNTGGIHITASGTQCSGTFSILGGPTPSTATNLVAAYFFAFLSANGNDTALYPSILIDSKLLNTLTNASGEVYFQFKYVNGSNTSNIIVGYVRVTEV